MAPDFLSTDPALIIPILAITGGCTVALIAILAGAATKIARYVSFERTRREVAAYLSEGSITLEEADHIIAKTPGKYPYIA